MSQFCLTDIVIQHSSVHINLPGDARLFLKVHNGETVIQKITLIASGSEPDIFWRSDEKIEITCSFRFSVVMECSDQDSQIVGSTELLIESIQTHLAEKGSGAEFSQNLIMLPDFGQLELVAAIISADIPPLSSGPFEDDEEEQAFLHEVQQGSITESISSVLDLEYFIADFKHKRALALPDDDSRKLLQLTKAGDRCYAFYQEDARFLDKAIEIYNDVAKNTPDYHASQLEVLALLGQFLLLRIQDKGLISDADSAILCFERCVVLSSQHDLAKAWYMRKLGMLLHGRSKQTRELSDIRRAILVQEDAAELTPEDHADKLSLLNDIGNSLVDCFDCTGEIRDLARAISTQEEALRIIPKGHADEPACMNNLGSSLLRHFKYTRDNREIERAILLNEDAVRHTSDGHINKPLYLNSLGNTIIQHFKQTGDLKDIDRAISLQEASVRLTFEGHAGKPGFLNNLGNSFVDRFEHMGDIDDLNRAISFQEEALRLIQEGHPEKAACMNNLGSSLLNRYKCTKDQSDVEKAISLQEYAVRHTPEGHIYKKNYLSSLGNSILQHFKHTRNLKDIDRAISCHEEAVRLTQESHVGEPGHLNNLGNSLLHRFECTGELTDLDRVISIQEEALQLAPECHDDKPACLSNLGSSLLNCFKYRGDHSDVERAISVQEDAVKHTSDGHVYKQLYLDRLGNSILQHFKLTGNLRDLDRAILLQEDSVRLTSDGNSSKPNYLNNIGNLLVDRFKQTGDVKDLDRAISLREEALRLTPEGHADKPAFMNNLGSSLLICFEYTRDHRNIDRAILLQEDAVGQTPENHPNRPLYLGCLGNSILTHFEHTGDLKDIDRAISLQEESVKLTPEGHADKPGFLNNLGNSFNSCFERTGNLRDIDSAISIQQQVLGLTPDGHPDQPASMSNLGHSIFCRFKHTGDLRDLERAISFQEDAVKHAPEGHPHKPRYLNNLGNSIIHHFECTGDLSAVDRAILLQEDAVSLTPENHADKPGRLNNLGISLGHRFQHKKDAGDVDLAISFQEDAVSLIPRDNPHKPAYMINLGKSCLQRFEHTKDLRDVDRAILLQSDAIKLTPEHHANRTNYFSSLGDSLHCKFLQTGQHSDLQLALHNYELAATLSTGQSLQQFSAASQWARLCYSSEGATASLKAYAVALDLMPHVAWLGHTISQRHTKIASIGKIAGESTAVAIAANEFGLALEWLEQGRSIVWQQLLQLRTPVDDLHDEEPALANELVQVSKDLELAGHKDHNILEEKSNIKIGYHQSMEMAAQQHHRLAEQWESLIKRIRSLPEFENFLKPKRLTNLLPAAIHGPVVVINIDSRRCDALVIQAGHDEVLNIPLVQFSYEKASKLNNFLSRTLKSPHLRGRSRGKVEPVSEGGGFKFILAELWSDIVKPVLDILAFMDKKSDLPPRVWWCPTGPLSFLPIHAAGVYDQTTDAVDISDFVCSSYTPSLTAIINGLAAQKKPHTYKGILAISQKNTPKKSVLHNAEEEVNQVLKHADNLSIQDALHLQGPSASVESVVSNMEKFSWIHLACHAVQASGTPTDSAFCLSDGDLKLSRIITMSNKDAEFAFLSACQTATGDKNLSEEAAHLAAGMQLAGYRSVIATMWPIRDHDAPIVANTVYSHLFRGPKPDGAGSAHALHQAVKELREKVGVSEFVRWIPFIHVGI